LNIFCIDFSFFDSHFHFFSALKLKNIKGKDILFFDGVFGATGWWYNGRASTEKNFHSRNFSQFMLWVDFPLR
jgi:hypothetical protein